MIPLSDKDAEDLQRWNNEQEDQRRRTSIQGKSKPGMSGIFTVKITPEEQNLPKTRRLERIMQEPPLGAGKPRSSQSQTEVKKSVRTKNPLTGEWETRVVQDLTEEQIARREITRPISSIKFIEGNVYVNGDFAPELTNTLKSVIKGTVQLPTGVVPRQVYGQPTMIGQQPQQIPALAADGVRVTDSLVRTYISQLEKQSGQKGTLLPRQIQFGPELYNRLFGTTREVFVFGSNEQGIHGKGAALTAVKQHGAIRGQGVGIQGDSYAIPTKSTPYKTLPLTEIKKYVDDFLDFARKNPDIRFNLTAIGTGLAGYKSEEIAPFFADAPDNVVKPTEFGGRVKEPNVINVRKLAANIYEGDKFTSKDLPKGAVYVGRNYTKGKYQLQGTPWGNPYRVGPDGNLDQVLDKYEGWARTQLSKNPNWLQPLIGKDLVDWCEPGKCHADVLKKLIKEQVGEFERTPVASKAQLQDIDAMRARYNELNDLKKSRGGSGLSPKQYAEFKRLEEAIFKATTLDPTQTEMPEDTRGFDEEGRKVTSVSENKPKYIAKFTNEYRFLSNSYRTPINVEGITYQNAEAAIQASRTDDIEIKKKFVNLSARQAIELGREIKTKPKWNRDENARKVLLIKFQQNEELRQKLISTGKTPLLDEDGDILRKIRKDYFGMNPNLEEFPKWKAKKPEGPKVAVRSIGEKKIPVIYADGRYNPEATYQVVKAMVRAKEDKSFWQTLSRQGGIRVGNVFVSVADMEQLAKSIPADTEITYTRPGKVTAKPRTAGGSAFSVGGKTIGALGIVASIGDILRMTKEWSEMGTRKVPVS